MSREDDAMKEGCAGDPWLCLLPLRRIMGCPWGRPEAMYTFLHTRKCPGVFWGWDGESACHGSPPLPPPLGYAAVAPAHMVQGLLIHF